MNLSRPIKKTIKSQRKRTIAEDRNRETTKQPENNEQNDSKYIPTNNYLKMKWTKFSNQKTE